MPPRSLPSFTLAEIQSPKSSSSCFVTLGDKVYDVADFIESHPGGPELILEYVGKDITNILKDEISHTHSDSAYEMIDEYHVGFLQESGKLSSANGFANGSANGVASGVDTSDDENPSAIHPRTGMSCEEDLSKDTDIKSDYKKHKFLDLDRPLLMQVWFGGFSKRFYLDQVHRPRHYKGGKSAPLFGNFLEPLSLTPWWVVPLVWLPCVTYGLHLASFGFVSVLYQAPFFGFGLVVWTLLEYILHRFLFHLD